MDSFCECVGNSSVTNGHGRGWGCEQIFLDRDVVITAYCRNVYVDNVTAATLNDWLLSVWSLLPLRESEYYVLGLKPTFLPHPAVWLPFSYFPGGRLLIGIDTVFLASSRRMLWVIFYYYFKEQNEEIPGCWSSKLLRDWELTAQVHVVMGFTFISIYLIWNLDSWNQVVLPWYCWGIFCNLWSLLNCFCCVNFLPTLVFKSNNVNIFFSFTTALMRLFWHRVPAGEQVMFFLLL